MEAALSTLDEAKAALRKAVFARRKAAHADKAGDAARAAAANFVDAFSLAPGEEVAGYRPIRTEIDPTPLMELLTAAGARLSVPVIVDMGEPLLFRRWTPGCAMIDGPFGAQIPAEGEDVLPSLFITPMVAFDRRGGRLGYGGGFYDRSFAVARAQRAIRAVGFAYAAQEVDETPRNATDQMLDAVITEMESIVVPSSV